MKILIHILFILGTFSLSAQSSIFLKHYFEKKQATAKATPSIMFKNTKPSRTTQHWKKGLAQRKESIIHKNTFKGALIGTIGGGLIMAPLQVILNGLSPLLLGKESRDFKLIAAGAVIGGAIGIHKGSVIGKRKAEDLEYLEFIENGKKEHSNRIGK